MVPILLFGLVGIVGVAAIFRVLGDETDYAGDDLDDDDAPPGKPSAEEAVGPAPKGGDDQGEPKDP